MLAAGRNRDAAGDLFAMTAGAGGLLLLTWRSEILSNSSHYQKIYIVKCLVYHMDNLNIINVYFFIVGSAKEKKYN